MQLIDTVQKDKHAIVASWGGCGRPRTEVEFPVEQVEHAGVVGPRGGFLGGVTAKRLHFAIDSCLCLPFLLSFLPRNSNVRT